MPDFIALDALVGQTAAITPERIAVIDGERQLSYHGLDKMIDRAPPQRHRQGAEARAEGSEISRAATLRDYAYNPAYSCW
jgi:hypothetical protein